MSGWKTSCRKEGCKENVKKPKFSKMGHFSCAVTIYHFVNSWLCRLSVYEPATYCLFVQKSKISPKPYKNHLCLVTLAAICRRQTVAQLPPPPPVFPSSFQTRKGRIYVLMVKYSEGSEKIPREKTERRRSFEHLAAGAATFARLEKVTSDIVSFRVWLAQVTPLEWLFVLEKLCHVIKKISLLKDTDL